MNDKAKEAIFLVSVYVAMLAGMAAKTVFDHIQSGIDLDLKNFLMPLVVSPMVYGCVFKIARGSDETVLMLIVGFQNGFFWQDIISHQATPTTS